MYSYCILIASELLAVWLNFMGGVGRPTSEECSAVLFYRSESPSQVFLIVISWLFEILQSVPQSDWSSIILSYDNMCHLDGLRAATAPLPLPQPYNTMWKEITKVYCGHSAFMQDY